MAPRKLLYGCNSNAAEQVLNRHPCELLLLSPEVEGGSRGSGSFVPEATAMTRPNPQDEVVKHVWRGNADVEDEKVLRRFGYIPDARSKRLKRQGPSPVVKSLVEIAFVASTVLIIAGMSGLPYF